MPDIRIGISGWQYDGWRGAFYPPKLPQRHELAYASRLLNSIEINGTFYSLKRPGVFEAWRDATPEDFVFAVKGSRYITHTLRLRVVDEALGNFFANGLLKLGRKLGPILWQLPPRMSWEPSVFKRFCEMLPKTAKQAANVARRHDARIEGRAWYDTDEPRQIRHAFEIRDERMLNAYMVRTLRDHGHALVLADAGKYPSAEDITAGFIYARLHGAEQMYVSGYNGADLDRWAGRLEQWAHGEQVPQARQISQTKPPPRKTRDVYVYFDNDVKVHAPFNALGLAQRLNVARPLEPVTIAGRSYPLPPRLKEEQEHEVATAAGR
ncbi:MAG: DUF72 domain-containing protein [Phycisphaeraceae bacterium]